MISFSPTLENGWKRHFAPFWVSPVVQSSSPDGVLSLKVHALTPIRV